jgi:hypothetical protein
MLIQVFDFINDTLQLIHALLRLVLADSLRVAKVFQTVTLVFFSLSGADRASE